MDEICQCRELACVLPDDGFIPAPPPPPPIIYERVDVCNEEQIAHCPPGTIGADVVIPAGTSCQTLIFPEDLAENIKQQLIANMLANLNAAASNAAERGLDCTVPHPYPYPYPYPVGGCDLMNDFLWGAQNVTSSPGGIAILTVSEPIPGFTALWDGQTMLPSGQACDPFNPPCLEDTVECTGITHFSQDIDSPCRFKVDIEVVSVFGNTFQPEATLFSCNCIGTGSGPMEDYTPTADFDTSTALPPVGTTTFGPFTPSLHINQISLQCRLSSISFFAPSIDPTGARVKVTMTKLP